MTKRIAFWLLGIALATLSSPLFAGELRFPDAVKADAPVFSSIWDDAEKMNQPVKSDFAVEWWQFVNSAQDAQPVFTIGGVEVGLRPIPASMVKDPPRVVLGAGETVRTKVFGYPGKWFFFALTVKNSVAQLYVNGYPDGDSFDGKNLAGKFAVHPAGSKSKVREITLYDSAPAADSVLAHFKSYFPAREVLLSAHRGDNHASPENTNVSYVNAINLGATIVEMDLRLTKDDVLILLHDKTIDRTSNGKGDILKTSLADAEKFDFGTWKNPKFAGEPIPKVATIADTCRGKAIMMLDLKCTGLGKSLAALKKEKAIPSDQWILAPWEEQEGVALRQYLPDVPMVLLTSKVPADKFDDAYFDRMKKTGFSGFSIAYPKAPQAFIDAAHQAGMKVWVWTINDAPDIAGAVAAGVDGIVTDDPGNSAKLVRELTSR